LIRKITRGWNLKRNIGIMKLIEKNVKEDVKKGSNIIPSSQPIN